MGYDNLKLKLNEIGNVIQALEDQKPIDRVRDKCGLNFYFIRLEGSRFKKAILGFGATHGSYGNSSAHDDMSELLADTVTKVLKQNESFILAEATNLLLKKKKALAEEAAKEAKKIIKLAEEI